MFLPNTPDPASMVDETRISSPSDCRGTKRRVTVATVCNGATNPGLICHPHRIRCAHLPSSQDQMCSSAILTGSDVLICHPHRIRCVHLPPAQDQMCSSAILTGSDVLICHPHRIRCAHLPSSQDQMCSSAILTGSDVLICHPHRIRCVPATRTGSDVLICHPHRIRCAHLPPAQDQMCSSAILTGSDVHSGDTTTKRVSEIIGIDRYVLMFSDNISDSRDRSIRAYI